MSELNKSILLSDKINESILSIDEDMSVHTFAKAVALVLVNEYGEHNYEAFTTALKNNL